MPYILAKLSGIHVRIDDLAIGIRELAALLLYINLAAPPVRPKIRRRLDKLKRVLDHPLDALEDDIRRKRLCDVFINASITRRCQAAMIDHATDHNDGNKPVRRMI